MDPLGAFLDPPPGHSLGMAATGWGWQLLTDRDSNTWVVLS